MEQQKRREQRSDERRSKREKRAEKRQQEMEERETDLAAAKRLRAGNQQNQLLQKRSYNNMSETQRDNLHGCLALFFFVIATIATLVAVQNSWSHIKLATQKEPRPPSFIPIELLDILKSENRRFKTVRPWFVGNTIEIEYGSFHAFGWAVEEMTVHHNDRVHWRGKVDDIGGLGTFVLLNQNEPARIVVKPEQLPEVESASSRALEITVSGRVKYVNEIEPASDKGFSFSPGQTNSGKFHYKTRSFKIPITLICCMTSAEEAEVSGYLDSLADTRKQLARLEKQKRSIPVQIVSWAFVIAFFVLGCFCTKGRKAS